MDKEKVKLSQLTANDRNPRTITKENLAKLICSILVLPKMLELRPIVTDDTLCALGGNKRYEALTAIASMRRDEMMEILLSSRDYRQKTEAEQDALVAYWDAWRENPEVYVVRASDLTEAERREFIVKDNVSYGEWDTKMLFDDFEVDELKEWGVSDVEFPEAQEEPGKEDGYSSDDAENAPTRCQAGEVWMLGRHRLMCGDSMNGGDVDRLMDGESADLLLLTDPPYNVDYEGGTKDRLKIANDNMDDDSFIAFLTAAFENAVRVMRPGAAFYIWHADSKGWEFRTALRSVGLTLRETLIWVKNSLVLGRQDYQWRHEPCLYGWKDGASHYFIDDRSQDTVFEDAGVDYRKLKKGELLKLVLELTAPLRERPTTVIYEDKPTKNDIHPTMKPVKLMARLVQNSSKEDETVLDLFGGSGSTLIACEQLNRRCFTMEYDPRYCDAIIDRWEKLTGRTAELIK